MKLTKELFFPWLESIKANKKITAKINKIISDGLDASKEYMEGYEKLSYEDLKIFFDKTIDVKKSLEDKLKTSLFSITVGITLLISALSILYNDGMNSTGIIYKGFVFFLGSVAIAYMILAGLFAIRTISGFIQVYQLFPEDLSLSEDEKKETIATNTELNSLSNIIRQNLMNISFRCIINSLFVLSVFFVLLGIGSFVPKDKSIKPELNVYVLPYKLKFDSLKNEIVVINKKQLKFNSNLIDRVDSVVESDSIKMVQIQLLKYQNKIDSLNLIGLKKQIDKLGEKIKLDSLIKSP